jgi:acyl-coenzyme A thioesterase PaaI-like protein
VPLGHLLVLTAASTITYSHPSQGSLRGRAKVLHEQREQLQASWKDRGRARVTVPVEIIDASGEIVTTLSVSCVLLPR